MLVYLILLSTVKDLEKNPESALAIRISVVGDAPSVQLYK